MVVISRMFNDGSLQPELHLEPRRFEFFLAKGQVSSSMSKMLIELQIPVKNSLKIGKGLKRID